MKFLSNLFRWLRVLGTIAVGGNATFGGSVTPTGDNTQSFGGTAARWQNGYFGTNLGVHDGTRFRGLIASNGAYSMTDSGGNSLTRFDATGDLAFDQPANGGTCMVIVRMINKSTAATVQGKVYTIMGAADNSVGVLMGTAASYSAASNGGQLFVCIGGGIADGSADDFVPLINGMVVPIYCDGAMTRGQYCNRSAANAGQGANSAGAAAGLTYGMNMAATGGAGLCNVRIGLVWS